MNPRKFLFWCHLTAGVLAGVVILIMSVTGALLAYEKQIIAYADARTYSVTPQEGAPRLSMETLIAKAQEAEPNTSFTTVIARADARAAVAFVAGPRTLFIHPYSGVVMGEGSPGVRRAFRFVTDLHRALAFSGDRRPIGRAITGAANLAFLFIVSSGLYLWWPRTRTWRHLRTVTMFKGDLRGRARDFNWHNAIGFWSAIPLFVIVLGSVVISYPWASDMVYRMVGEPPPPRAGAVAASSNAPQGRTAAGGRGTDSPRQETSPTMGIDALWARAEQQVPAWRSISFRIPTVAASPVVFTIDEGTGGEPQKRGTLTLNRPAADVAKWEPFASLSRGRRVRSWLRFAHTGEVYGLVGQTIAGLVSAGGAVLVYTGLALAFRRFLAWQVRLRNARRVAEATGLLRAMPEASDGRLT